MLCTYDGNPLANVGDVLLIFQTCVASVRCGLWSRGKSRCDPHSRPEKVQMKPEAKPEAKTKGAAKGNKPESVDEVRRI